MMLASIKKKKKSNILIVLKMMQSFLMRNVKEVMSVQC